MTERRFLFSKPWFSLFATLLLGLALFGCPTEEQDVGDMIEDAVEDAADEIGDAVETASEEVDEMTEEIEEAVEGASEEDH